LIDNSHAQELLPNNEINNIAYFDPLSFNNKVIVGKGFFMMKWNVKKKNLFLVKKPQMIPQSQTILWI
jgi:hypothetical protein